MKRFLAIILTLLCLTLTSCSNVQDTWDIYKYDGYLNARWGMTPDETVYALGINRSQIERISDRELTGLPEGTFGYEVTKYSSKQGVRVRAYLYFAETLFDDPQYVGLYAMKVVYEEGILNSKNGRIGEEVDGKEVIDELWKRALYNTQYSETVLDDGSMLYCQYCENTPSTVGGSKQEALLEAISDNEFPFDMILDGDIAAQPLSTLRFSYGSEEECSAILYEGYLAAMLHNIDNFAVTPEE